MKTLIDTISERIKIFHEFKEVLNKVSKLRFSDEFDYELNKWSSFKTISPDDYNQFVTHYENLKRLKSLIEGFESKNHFGREYEYLDITNLIKIYESGNYVVDIKWHLLDVLLETRKKSTFIEATSLKEENDIFEKDNFAKIWMYSKEYMQCKTEHWDYLDRLTEIEKQNRKKHGR